MVGVSTCDPDPKSRAGSTQVLTLEEMGVANTRRPDYRSTSQQASRGRQTAEDGELILEMALYSSSNLQLWVTVWLLTQGVVVVVVVTVSVFLHLCDVNITGF